MTQLSPEMERVLAELTDDQERTLRRLVDAQERRRARALSVAIDQGLGMIPRPLRGLIKKLVFG